MEDAGTDAGLLPGQALLVGAWHPQEAGGAEEWALGVFAQGWDKSMWSCGEWGLEREQMGPWGLRVTSERSWWGSATRGPHLWQCLQFLYRGVL